MERVTTIEVVFLYQWRVGVEQSGEGSLLWRCGFNASVSAREGRRRDEALPEDESEVANSRFNGKEA
jgi:hypothetical protein